VDKLQFVFDINGSNDKMAVICDKAVVSSNDAGRNDGHVADFAPRECRHQVHCAAQQVSGHTDVLL